MRFYLFNQLYKQHSASLILFATRFVDPDIAKDIVHDVFIKIWENQEIDLNNPKIKSYIAVATKNLCLDYIRKTHKTTYKGDDTDFEILMMELSDTHSILDLLILDEQNKSIRKAIETLPINCKQILKAFYFDNKSYAEIASLFKISPKTVGNQIYNGIKRLKASFKVK